MTVQEDITELEKKIHKVAIESERKAGIRRYPFPDELTDEFLGINSRIQNHKQSKGAKK